MERALRCYVDTSVFGGVFDPEFEEASKRFLELARTGSYVILVSDEVIRELRIAPSHVLALFEQLPPQYLEYHRNSEQALALASEYISAGVVGPRSGADALHVATATLAGADILLSWNFKHLVNIRRRWGYNGVNTRNGLREIDIVSPKELVYGDETG